MLAKKKRNLLLEVNLRKKKSQLTPKVAKLYTIANEYRSIARRLTNEVVTNRDRIKEAIKTTESGEIFQSLVNKTTFKFLQSQITQQLKKPKGRRPTLNDKLLSLALFKQSARGYRLLQKQKLPAVTQNTDGDITQNSFGMRLEQSHNSKFAHKCRTVETQGQTLYFNV
jgi:exonuclease VII large subunit